jgi:hypothetical protein
MRTMTQIFTSAALFAGSFLIGDFAQSATALPGYSARPVGMCWNRQVGSGNENNGYWAACKKASQNQAANSARAHAQSSPGNPTRQR